MSNELIKIEQQMIGDEEVNAVDARELWTFLQIGKDFSTWIKYQIERVKFVENRDYLVITKIVENPKGGRPTKDYALTLDTAKHIAMMSNTDKGYEVREYFIECERKLNTQITQREPMLIEEKALKLLKVNKEAAELLGLKDNHAIHAANRATRKRTGVDFLSDLEITLQIEDKNRTLIPTEISEILIERNIFSKSSAQSINKLLEFFNFQTNINKKWTLTNKGKQFGELTLIENPRSKNGKLIQQLQWKSAIIDYLADNINCLNFNQLRKLNLTT